jgi:hypothetical protein
MDKTIFSSLISFIVAIIVLLASFFQWWDITYDGKMNTKKWVKILFVVLMAALLTAGILILTK